MRIAVNTRLLIPNKLDGIGWFTHEVLQRLVKMRPNDEFLFLFDRTFSDEFIYADNVWAKELFPQARHPLLYRMYFEYSIAIFIRSLASYLSCSFLVAEMASFLYLTVS